ncbi:MAG: hypothetical protein K9N09_06490 [Candidatus Cloacimonetes bacterium]|nr:hypothetical protein [Candidatus Cloacimonadota bacterium]MCF7813655.1 hypothetical protein [Candidatus Cloacimonadota bacterium]MCF7868334.1 hypothetical protein [Candidatus Cloacimonadota bacterium]MCF7883808.1 hypothetical protein [Candidatus Cloacimonadota bacterium]
MFNAQATNSNRQAVIGDLNNLAASALAFYKTPATHSGGGSSWSSDVDNVGNWLGYSYDASTNTLTTGNGTFVLSVASDVLTIVGTGSETGNDGSTSVQAQIAITGSTSSVATTVNN